MWKNSLNCSTIIAKYWIAYKMQFVSNGCNILKVNGSTHVHMLIIEKMWKEPLIHSNINARFKTITCVLINYGKYKMQLLSNGFNMLKFVGWIHVPCW